MLKKLFLISLFLFIIPMSFASPENEGHGSAFALTFLFIAIILIVAKLSGLVEKWGQPAVLGELVVGVILGNLVLLGIHVLEPIKHNNIIAFLAELGVVVLLFQIGLESHISEMKKVGLPAILVAIVGVVLPFVLGTWVIGPLLLPNVSFNTYLFLGATLTATSVGITARVFKDLGYLQSKEAKIVLGAAVIDDVLGLILLAIVTGIVTAGSIGLGSIGLIFLKALLFLVGAIVLGQLIAPGLSKMMSKIHAGVGMKFTLAISFALLFAFVADLMGLAAIIGAFAAGLILDPVHFRHFQNYSLVHELRDKFCNESSEAFQKLRNIIDRHAQKHIHDIIEPIGHFLIPIFFVVTGFSVDLSSLFNLSTFLIALGITVMAVLGKVAAGFASKGINKWVVGWAMVPRGEVGLIFATIGKGLGVINDQIFSIVIIMVILTTLLPPPILAYLLKKKQNSFKKEE